MTILLIGCVESSLRFLGALIRNNNEIVGVVTKRASSFNSDYKDLTPLCLENGIEIFYFDGQNVEDMNGFILQKSPDAIFCFGWSHLLPEETITLAKYMVVGYHPAELPKNRGRHPIVWALALGLSQTASTFFEITAGVDEGDILSQVAVPISPEDDARTLYDKLLETGEKQVVKIAEELNGHTIQRIPQRELSLTTNSWRKRGKEDGRIDFRMHVKTICNLVRSLTRPYAGAHFVYKAQEYKVWKAAYELDVDGNFDNIEYGKIIKVFSSTSFQVKADGGLVTILDCDPITLKEGSYL